MTVETSHTADAVHATLATGVAPAAVWRALTDRGELAQWLGTVVEGDFRVGERVVIEHDEEHLSSSRVLTAEPGQRLVLTWDFPEEPITRVEFAITGDPATLAVTHTDLRPEPMVLDYETGWRAHLERLGEVLAR